MRGTLIKLVLAGALAATAATPGLAKKRWNSGDTAALITGLAIGGIAASAASRDYYYKDQYVPPPPAYRPAAPFSPAAGIICYPRQVACYDNAGRFSAKWTNRVF
ncbi:hypothetical protein RB623_20430 [Mesorhizobium sp. LHD-90]|uniref:hypothetical protein n=1 Tax=Mesorhizobium sp. LHD-90 TaxID=3071414 RepID=UPI0027DECEF1|nr:hypothetical protein [Mesorhizobium sp. LHD-90]MDQ6436424.1 hypothetical protein [Mesorhizobium sp. LHD-90]